MQNQQQKIEYTEFAPSFSCYSSDSITSRAVAKAIHEEETARLHKNGDIGNNDDFEFALVSSDEESNSKGWTVFKHDLIGSLEEYSSSSSSSEADELESPRSRTKCKKSSSTGSGSKRWIFRYLLRRSNSDGMVSTPKKAESPKEKMSYDEVWKGSGRWKAHERFYEQKRAQKEVEKRRSYLPYRQDVVGLFANVKGMGKIKMLPS